MTRAAPHRPARSARTAQARPAAQPSALLLALVRRSRWLWLGWLEAKWAGIQRWRAERVERRASARAAAQRPERATFETLEPKLLLSAELMPVDLVGPPAVMRMIDSAPQTLPQAQNLALAGSSRALADSASIAPAVTLTGPGTGQLVAQGGGYKLQLQGTSAATSVAVVVSGGGRLALTGLSANSAVGSLNLANADLTGVASFAGGVSSLTLGQVSNSSITVAGSADLSIKASSVSTTRLSALAANVSVSVTDWTSGTPGASRIEAAGLKSLLATGNVAADLFLSGVASGYTLGSVQVGGTLTGGLWSVHGRANSINAGSTAAAWRVNISNTLAQLVTKGDASGDMAVGGLQLLQVGGSARGLHLLVGADLGDDAALGGTGANADSFKPGTLARVRITGDLIDSSLLVSIDPVNSVHFDGNDRQLGTVVQRLQELVVGGLLKGNTSIVAPAYPVTVKVGGQTLNPASLRALQTTPRDTLAPALVAGLLNDTGSNTGDGLTNDPTLAATATDAGGIASIQGRMAGGSFVDLTVSTRPDGSVLISRSELARINGGVLPDGSYQVQLRAIDRAGNASTTASVMLQLKTSLPATATIGLDTASDSAPLGDLSTSTAIVKLVGRSDKGVSVGLRRTGEASDFDSTTTAADGSFSFDAVALAMSANAFTLTLNDAAGNTRSQAFSVNREVPDTTAPTLTAALQTDSGRSATDRITNSAALAGKVGDNVGVSQLLAALDPSTAPGATPAYTNLVASVQADGSFVISAAQLAALAGGSLADGAHTVRLQAKDAAGNASPTVDVSFTLDTQAPSGAAFGITSADALAGTDNQTGATIVTLRGTADAGSTITLAGQAANSTASAAGVFQLPGVNLGQGDNSVSLTVTDAAGNSQTVTRTLTRVAQPQADAVLDWIGTALQTIQLDATDPPVATRVLAIQSIAVYDSLAAIQGTPAFLVQRTVTGAVSADAAAAQAAYRVLYQLYPAQRSALTAALSASLAKITDGAAKTAGIALGDSIAVAVLAIRASDGYLNYAADDGSTQTGLWRPTGPMYMLAQDPQWAQVTPFALSSGDEFRASAPPSLDSAAYASALNEVKAIGSATNSTRTADQTQQALFWADGGGSYTPAGHWVQIAAQVAQAKGQSLSANARLMAQLSVALADSSIAAWDSKYTYDLWRPVTAIQNADADNNAATTQDAAWTPLLITPPHPSYVSGHSTYSAAAADILAATFGNNIAFSTTSATLPGVTRSFSSFTQAADEAGTSRVYGGIHTSLDNLAGKTLGSLVGQAVLAKFALTEDTQAPIVALDNSAAATNANLTFTGQVLDNLSGVASAQVRINAGALQALTLDATGHFSFTTALALTGSADGSHTATIIARDAAGNISAGYTRGFTLDTQAPTLSLTSLANGDSLTTASRLAGAADATGSALTQLSYSVDGSAVKTLIFDATSGSFDQALALGNLGIGNHTLSLSARDAAGNTATLSRNVKVDALPLLSISSLSPTSGSADVGSTFRPRVVFSRAVNPSTLNGDSFYATGTDGAKLAATVVPSDDGTYAWLFFTNPLPSGSTITLHVDGSAIRAAADGTLLDADGNGQAGGALTASFTTVSLSPVLGTKLVGRVVDPGVDIQPMTFDDIRRGPDGVIHTPDDVFLNPIAHAKVQILGTELVAYTDANGRFEFNDVPTGTIKLAIDGRTATNMPTGIFWPEMVMDLSLRPGITNTAMGSMGSLQEQQDNADRSEIYLPRVLTSTLQNIATSAPTTVTTLQEAAPNLTDEQRSKLTLTVQPNTAIGTDGKPIANVQVGMATVPAELVKDMLPPGVTQHTFDITIQAPGVAAFSTPLQITFPNVFDATPGTKLNVLSFDHTTGRLVINGTATVSADGKSVVSDEGSGVVAPGWHGLVPPSTTTHPGGLLSVSYVGVDQNHLLKKDGESFKLTFSNNDTLDVTSKSILIKIVLDDGNSNGNNIAQDFISGLSNQEIILAPSQSISLKITAKDKSKQFLDAQSDAMFGSKVTVQTFEVDSNGNSIGRPVGSSSFFVYRYVDAADADPNDSVLTLAPAVPVIAPAETKLDYIARTRQLLLDNQIAVTGITIITHGFQPNENGDSLYSLAKEVFDRSRAEGISSWLLDYDEKAELLALDETLGGGSSDKHSILPTAADSSKSGHLVILWDWAKQSNEASNGWGSDAGDALFSMLVGSGLVNLNNPTQNPPLHFIGHSLGAAVTSETVKRLAYYDVPVDQVTYLDPHDFDQKLGLPGFKIDTAQQLWTLGDSRSGLGAANGNPGYGATVWSNVAFADVYYQNRDHGAFFDFLGAVPAGRMIPGAYGVFLNQAFLPKPPPLLSNPWLPDLENKLGSDHSFVWDSFYSRSVSATGDKDRSAPESGLKPLATVPSIDNVITGFDYSRFGGYQRPEPNGLALTKDRPRYPGLSGYYAEPDPMIDRASATNWDPFIFINGDFESTAYQSMQPGWSI